MFSNAVAWRLKALWMVDLSFQQKIPNLSKLFKADIMKSRLTHHDVPSDTS